MFGYNLYGLKVNSEIQIIPYKKQRSAYKNPDTTIRLAKIKKPKEGQEDTYYYPFTIFNKDIYFQEISMLAKYLINGKSEVFIHPHKKQTAHLLSLFFVDSILPILLIKNGLFPVNASSVECDGKIYLFASQNGGGKSSLAANLCLNQGCKFVSDDLSILRWNEEKNIFESKCYHPWTTLWGNMIGIFKKDLAKYKRVRVRKSLLKFSFNLTKLKSIGFKPVVGIITINVVNSVDDPKTNLLKGIQKMKVSKNIIHSQQVAKVVLKQKELFQFSSLLAQKMNIYNVTRAMIHPFADFTKYVKNEILKETT